MGKLVYITRKEHFNAAHRLYKPEWSEEKNYEVFGKCANKNWHGHNFDLYVTVKGIPDPETGMVVDLKKMSKIIKEKVVDVLDHSNLNEDVPFLKGIMPTIENVIVKIWEQLEPEFEDGKLHSLKLYETAQNFVEYYGE